MAANEKIDILKCPPGELPTLSPGEMSALSPSEALRYLRKEYGMVGLTDADVTGIIKKYRDDRLSIRDVARECGVSTTGVQYWLQRAEQMHILRIRRGGDKQMEKAEKKQIEAITKAVTIEQKQLEEDAKVRTEIRQVIGDVLSAIKGMDLSETRFKDLVDGLDKLIKNDRLLGDKSTSNIQQRTLVEHIQHVNSLSLKEKMRLVKERHRMPKQDAPEGDDVTH